MEGEGLEPVSEGQLQVLRRKATPIPAGAYVSASERRAFSERSGSFAAHLHISLVRLTALGAAATLAFACSGFAAEPSAPAPPAKSLLDKQPDPRIVDPPKPDLSAEIEARKSYVIPALEILGFDVLLNRFDNHFLPGNDYDVNASTWRRNLRNGWVTDKDPFKVNQLGHPYQGSMYHGFARSAGLNYWESLGYTFAGSAFWEVFGERTPPSRNDQITTGIGGTFLGEALFRMSSLVLEKGEGPKFWREVSAAVISPSTGFNRLAFDKRFDTIFASRNPTYYSRLGLGIAGTTQNVPGTTTAIKRNEAQADFSLDYGLPGKPGYTYTRPFDYFTFQGTASSANVFENVMTRGLLIGKDYEAGKNIRGVWGLYGSYDYISPQAFRISSTALSLGTTGQMWLTNSIALQGTAMAGVGYAAASTIRGVAENDYHFGVAPQALLATRLIFGETAALDVTAREYFVSRVAAANTSGRDNIARADVAFTLRIHRQHAIAVKYLWNRRDAHYIDLGDRTQTRGTFGIFYTLLGHERFGATEWR